MGDYINNMKKWLIHMIELWRLRRTTICYLQMETQKNQWCNSFQAQRLKNEGANGVKLVPRAEDKYSRSSRKLKAKKTEFFFHPPFCLIQALKDWMVPTTLGRLSILYVHSF